MSWHDPCPLRVLAEHMRDGTWLDVRTEDGLLERVRITEIRVRVQGEDVIVRQDWLHEEDYRRAEHALDSDVIWRVNPTTRKIADVTPFGGVTRTVQAGEPAAVIGAIVGTVVFTAGGKAEELTSPRVGKEPWELTNARHQGIYLAFEMTDLSGHDICTGYFGYKSQGPFLLARDKARHSLDAQTGYYVRPTATSPNDWVKQLRRLAGVVDQQLGFKSRRAQWWEGEIRWLPV